MKRGILVILLLLLVGGIAIGCKRTKREVQVLCGGLMNFACPSGQFCRLKEECGGMDLEGFCAVQPQSCPADHQPVCGCDGESYAHPCLAEAKGVTVRSTGMCPQKEQVGREAGSERFKLLGATDEELDYEPASE